MSLAKFLDKAGRKIDRELNRLADKVHSDSEQVKQYAGDFAYFKHLASNGKAAEIPTYLKVTCEGKDLSEIKRKFLDEKSINDGGKNFTPAEWSISCFINEFTRLVQGHWPVNHESVVNNIDSLLVFVDYCERKEVASRSFFDVKVDEVIKDKKQAANLLNDASLCFKGILRTFKGYDISEELRGFTYKIPGYQIAPDTHFLIKVDGGEIEGSLRIQKDSSADIPVSDPGADVLAASSNEETEKQAAIDLVQKAIAAEDEKRKLDMEAKEAAEAIEAVRIMEEKDRAEKEAKEAAEAKIAALQEAATQAAEKAAKADTAAKLAAADAEEAKSKAASADSTSRTALEKAIELKTDEDRKNAEEAAGIAARAKIAAATAVAQADAARADATKAKMVETAALEELRAAFDVPPAYDDHHTASDAAAGHQQHQDYDRGASGGGGDTFDKLHDHDS